jgi:anion-transporting  ArsA/GET3 family ATPase
VTAEVHLVCGVGGVGKTTLSAALGLAEARAGRRVVVITVDPARRLAEALGVALGGAPTPVPVGDGRLHALMLDPGAVFDRALLELAPDPRDARALLENRDYRAVSRRLAGAPEYVALVELHRLVEDGRWDVVVVDTPPAEDALDLFRAPERLRRVFGRSVLWALLQPGTRLAELLTRAGAATLARLIGGSVVDDIAAFFGLLAGTTEGFRAHAEAITALFRSDRARTWLVVDARAPDRGGAPAFRAALAELGPPFAGFLVNRVVEDPGPIEVPRPPCPPDLPLDPWTAAIDALVEAARGRAVEAAEHRDLVARLAREAPAFPIPELPPDADPDQALSALAGSLRDA